MHDNRGMHTYGTSSYKESYKIISLFKEFYETFSAFYDEIKRKLTNVSAKLFSLFLRISIFPPRILSERTLVVRICSPSLFEMGELTMFSTHVVQFQARSLVLARSAVFFFV